ncbi:putative guanylate kinase protein [Taeniopygia guttata]|uniref:Putative guanylate kinase protein n=1 Tax=Taeniopygia guttata TaxID=59729 RepID=B5G1T3_TAEGU|nr:putative guanylate kinase protein [Taeniopygia guttata]ACH45244.1 putative guanylate kinase protein [Taeniopygia guttata]
MLVNLSSTRSSPGICTGQVKGPCRPCRPRTRSVSSMSTSRA